VPARLCNDVRRVLRTVHAAHFKALPFERIVVHPELRHMIKKLAAKFLDVLNLLVLVRAGCYGN
jgi:hypothetical protein